MSFDDEIADRMFAERMQAIATLAGGLAHEINNPLAFISLNLDSIQEELRAPKSTDRCAELNAMIDEAREGVQRIQRIVRSISLFAHKSEGHRVPVSLSRVLDRAIESAGDLGAMIVRSDRGDVPIVRANETRLVQVFVCLLQNAARAMRDGARREIRASTFADGDRAVVEIEDSGHGIAADDRARIFDPFFSTRAVGEGLGLGLSVCHGIVRSLGGDIAVRSELGTGSVFRVTLPGDAQGPAEAIEKARPLAKAARRGKVLIVDDEVVFATSLRRVLSREHDVVVTSRGRDALEQIRGGTRYDAILCDLMMPELTGMELHAQLLDLAPDQADRMIFVTGGAFSEAGQKFLECLRTTWFEKPCDIPLLRAAVDALIR